jgi:hypothetical protein
MHERMILQRTLALILGGTMMAGAGLGFALDMGNMMSPSNWMGGNGDRGYDGGVPWGNPGYGGPGAYGGPYGPGGPASYGAGPYGGAPYGPGPLGAPGGYVPPDRYGQAPISAAPLAPAPLVDQALRIKALERRIADLEAEPCRRQPMPPASSWSSSSGYGPRAP